jgi:hypothetical protein
MVFNDRQWAMSTDNGRHWTAHNDQLSVEAEGGIGTLVFANPRDGWIESGADSLFQTTDGGRQWTPLGWTPCRSKPWVPLSVGSDRPTRPHEKRNGSGKQ